MLQKLVLILLLFSLFFKPTLFQYCGDITVSEAKTLIESDPSLTILDVRNQSEYDSGHIKNAKLIPLHQLESKLGELDKSSKILVYCRTGSRSATASQILEEAGFLCVYNMIGGVTAWSSLGYDVYVKFPSIQEAINSATAGTTLFVSSGTYREHLIINKTISLIGENRTQTIIDGNFTGNVVNITAPNSRLEGFTIQNSGRQSLNSGIYIAEGANSSNVSSNIVANNYVGILVYKSSDCIIKDNVVHSNLDDGVRLKNSHANTISRNTIDANVFYGVNLHDSNNNIISDNSVSNNIYGFCVNRNSNGNVATRNSFFSNSYLGVGIYWYSDNNVISYNIVSNNSHGADLFWGSASNLICANTFSHNDYGLWLDHSDNTFIFHNNFINNKQQAYSSDATNFLDNGFEGNYWSSFSGTDENRDGIGDTNYTAAPSNIDNCPLMGAFSSFNISATYSIDVISNSTINNLQFSAQQSIIKMHVSNTSTSQLFGFCRVQIPYSIMNQTYHVTINNEEPYFANYTLRDNGNNRWIYFCYEHSTLEATITYEYQQWMLLLLFAVATLLSSTVYRRRHAARFGYS
ncbi:right-handed parallel beta-helix repeat-containing protein [Candidatus Bathyarchaeota archaeon]|nr:right-handed parallel beta-helix repeat-containing protein [Candidatus Bathyarchaeota archaeon]